MTTNVFNIKLDCYELFTPTVFIFRLSPFGTLPQYGFDYWPKTAKIVQIEIDPRRIGLVRPVDVGINGDCKLAAQDLLVRLQAAGGVTALDNIEERMNKLKDVRETWENKLNEMTNDQTNAKEGKKSSIYLKQ